MDTRTGEIFQGEEIIKKAIQEKGGAIVPLTEAEFHKYSNLPREERSREWKLSEYLKTIKKSELAALQLFRIKAAFRAGYKAKEE